METLAGESEKRLLALIFQDLKNLCDRHKNCGKKFFLPLSNGKVVQKIIVFADLKSRSAVFKKLAFKATSPTFPL
jgi:hypothetical protein